MLAILSPHSPCHSVLCQLYYHPAVHVILCYVSYTITPQSMSFCAMSAILSPHSLGHTVLSVLSPFLSRPVCAVCTITIPVQASLCCLYYHHSCPGQSVLSVLSPFLSRPVCAVCTIAIPVQASLCWQYYHHSSPLHTTLQLPLRFHAGKGVREVRVGEVRVRRVGRRVTKAGIQTRPLLYPINTE